MRIYHGETGAFDIFYGIVERRFHCIWQLKEAGNTLVILGGGIPSNTWKFSAVIPMTEENFGQLSEATRSSVFITPGELVQVITEIKDTIERDEAYPAS